MDLHIRSAEAGDFEDIFPLFRQLWPNKQLNKEELQAVFLRGVASETDELFCAELNGSVIGFCAYAIVNNLWQEGRISYVYAMVVDESCRGRGFGTRLIRAAIERSGQQGLKRMELDSAFHREQAHKFYEKLGFEKRAYLFSYPL